MGHLRGKSPAFAQKRPYLWNFLPVFAFRSGCLLRPTHFFPPPLSKIRQKAESENEKPELDIGNGRKNASRVKNTQKNLVVQKITRIFAV